MDPNVGSQEYRDAAARWERALADLVREQEILVLARAAVRKAVAAEDSAWEALVPLSCIPPVMVSRARAAREASLPRALGED